MIYQTFFSMVPYLRAVKAFVAHVPCFVSTHQGKAARCSAREMSLWFSRAAMKLCNISEKGVCRKSSQASKTSSWAPCARPRPTSSDVSWHPMLHPAVSTKCSMAHRSFLTWKLGSSLGWRPGNALLGHTRSRRGSLRAFRPWVRSLVDSAPLHGFLSVKGHSPLSGLDYLFLS